MTLPRTASLLPSATEIVHALGAGDALVLRSHECDHPPGVRALPSATRPRVSMDGASAAIEEGIRALLREGLSVFHVDPEPLREAAPELILTQDQCEVCAVGLETLQEAVDAFLEPCPRIVSLSPATVAEVLDSFMAVADALGVPERGRALRAGLEARMAATARAVRGRKRPRVLTIEWLAPLMPAGNWIPELVEAAGGRNLLGEAGAHSGPVQWDVMRATEPDVVVVFPCGFPLERTRSEMDVLERLDGWDAVPAVRDGRVCIADGSAWFNRPGPRIAETLEILAEMLHPDAVEHRHRGLAWHVWEPVSA